MDTYDKSSHCGEDVTMDLVIAVDVSKAGPLRALKSRISSYLVRLSSAESGGTTTNRPSIGKAFSSICEGYEFLRQVVGAVNGRA